MFGGPDFASRLPRRCDSALGFRSTEYRRQWCKGNLERASWAHFIAKALVVQLRARSSQPRAKVWTDPWVAAIVIAECYRDRNPPPIVSHHFPIAKPDVLNMEAITFLSQDPVWTGSQRTICQLSYLPFSRLKRPWCQQPTPGLTQLRILGTKLLYSRNPGILSGSLRGCESTTGTRVTRSNMQFMGYFPRY